ncbi:MAG: hypothetical protein R2838_08235 [Caldilineaceae bacterium]
MRLVMIHINDPFRRDAFERQGAPVRANLVKPLRRIADAGDVAQFRDILCRCINAVSKPLTRTDIGKGDIGFL